MEEVSMISWLTFKTDVLGIGADEKVRMEKFTLPQGDRFRAKVGNTTFLGTVDFDPTKEIWVATNSKGSWLTNNQGGIATGEFIDI